jgi:pantoate--beta-alanine ligase
MVPTMGYLHAGHRALIEAAARACDEVVVTIFVNPTQFGPHEDFGRYPRDLDRDVALCEAAGATWVFAPDTATMYPGGADAPATRVVPPTSLTSGLCGAFRDGHFVGVATVVAKLFALWQPDRAYFGLKDFQQTAVLRALADDLMFPVEIVLAPTVREPDGLAMSSRNVYLAPDAREQALALSRALQAGWLASRLPAATPADVRSAAADVLSRTGGVQLQYLELVHRDTLGPLHTLSEPGVLAVAAVVDGTRLIDNAALDGPSPLAGVQHCGAVS